MSSLLYSLNILSLSFLATAHMELIWPIPFNSKFDASYYGNNVDWSNTDPLFSNGSNFPCKNYHLQHQDKVQVAYSAGQSYNISLTGAATHSGGSCQISLSYDNGQSFQVLKSMVGGCPLHNNWNFTVPGDAPSKPDALLAWSWFNLVGNREMYMNCVRVAIQAVNSTITPVSRIRPRKRQQLAMLARLDPGVKNASNVTTSFGGLPSMFACNVGNGCKTVEKREVVFPMPGPIVEYGVDAVVPDVGPGFVIASEVESMAQIVEAHTIS